MWQLPPLEWKDSVWRLPLGTHTAAEFVLALFAEPDACQRQLAQILCADAALTMWTVCRAGKWRDKPPTDSVELAEWLIQIAIPQGLLSVEPTCDKVEELSQWFPGATTNWEKCSARLRNWLVRAGLVGNGDSWQDCPWFPTWLDTSAAGAADTDSEVPPAPPASERNRTLAELLPRVLYQIQRLHALETNFSGTLEREKLAALRELAYGASHEINNPLANIATRAQTLLREERDPERKRKLATIAAQAFRAHEMISDMMLFAKPPVPAFQQIDAAEVIGTVVRECLPDAQAQQTQLIFHPPADRVVVSVDSTQLAVAIKALLRNALEALVSEGTVTVDIHVVEVPSSTGRWLEIIIRDSGPGISAEVRRHLFDPFYSGREAGRGLGFGLAKVWRIAELHRGTIQVESEPGKGAAFTLRIPT